MSNHKASDKVSHDPSGGPILSTTDRDLGPYWSRAHRDWRFWVGVVLLSAAIFIYVMSDNLTLIPRR
jgi:hypothetical protein